MSSEEESDLTGKIVVFPSKGVSSSESSRFEHVGSTQPNVYTPLSSTPQLESQHVSSSCCSSEGISKNQKISNKTSSDKSIKTKSSASRCPPVKNQRSSMRPFFCCGSELSLVSLVDGMELKEDSSTVKKLQSIECSSSSDEETPLSSPVRGRSNSVSSGPASRMATARRKKKEKHVVKKKFWSLRLQKKWSPRWRSRRSQLAKCPCDLSQQNMTSACSVSHNGAGPSSLSRQTPVASSVSRANSPSPLLDFLHLFPVEGIAEAAIRRRAEEMAAGLEIDAQVLSRALRSNGDVTGSVMDILRIRSRLGSANSDTHNSSDSPIDDLLVNNLIFQAQNSRGSSESWATLPTQIHTQIDYVHYLVPDLTKITACSYYWGVMDRYEAEHLLENKPPGTFLLRDSAQEDFLFSVSFRRYNRSLHARIEQWDHNFSFDAHDPFVFSASTVCELLEHYKDTDSCMFFEPMLTRPLHRTFPFSLQHMCRTVICDRISYDHIQALPIPNSFKKFLQTYHYKQKVRVRRFDAPEFASADSKVVN